MTQPRDDDDTSRRNRRSRQDRSEPQAPQSEATGPVVDQPGDEDAIDSAESRDEVQDGGQHADHDDGQDSDADEQDSSETAESTETTTDSSDEPVDAADSADTEDAADAADSDAEIPGGEEPDAPSGKPRRGPRRRHRTVGRSIARGVGVLSSVTLAAAVGGVTWWGHAVPTTPTPPLKALSLAQPGAASTYVCPHAPTNTLRGTDVGAMESTTTILPADGAQTIQSATYAGQAVPTDAVMGGLFPQVRPGEIVRSQDDHRRRPRGRGGIGGRLGRRRRWSRGGQRRTHHRQDHADDHQQHEDVHDRAHQALLASSRSHPTSLRGLVARKVSTGDDFDVVSGGRRAGKLP